MTILLKGGAAVTERQLTIITRAILTLEDPKVIPHKPQVCLAITHFHPGLPMHTISGYPMDVQR